MYIRKSFTKAHQLLGSKSPAFNQNGTEPIGSIVQRLKTSQQPTLQFQQDVLQLQQMMGNHAVVQLLAKVQKQNDVGNNSHIHTVASAGVQGTGSKLPHYAKIQASFGKHAISQARAYTNSQAASACHAMGAKAYATGNKIAFADFSPSLHTAAHEAAHIVQQRAGVNLKAGVGKSGDKYERTADMVADLVVRGQSAQSVLDAMADKGIATAGPQANVQAMMKVKVGEGMEGSEKEDKGQQTTTPSVSKFELIITQMSSLLDSGPVFIGENHDLTYGSDAILQLIKLGKVKKLFLEMPDLYSMKSYKEINPITTLEELEEVKPCFKYSFFRCGSRYLALIEEAVKTGVTVYSADTDARNITEFSEQMKARNEFTSNFIRSNIDKTGAYTVTLGGADHYTKEEYVPIHHQLGYSTEVHSRFFNLSSEEYIK